MIKEINLGRLTLRKAEFFKKRASKYYNIEKQKMLRKS